MKKIKLIEQKGYMFIASYGKEYEATIEEQEKIFSPLFKTKIIDGKFIFENDIEGIDLEKENKIQEIVNEFNKKIQDYNKKYPIEEQKRFSDKRIQAQNVLKGGEDIYIVKKAENLGISAEQFATLIIQKAEAFELFYTEVEIERDSAIAMLE